MRLFESNRRMISFVELILKRYSIKNEIINAKMPEGYRYSIKKNLLPTLIFEDHDHSQGNYNASNAWLRNYMKHCRALQSRMEKSNVYETSSQFRCLITHENETIQLLLNLAYRVTQNGSMNLKRFFIMIQPILLD